MNVIAHEHADFRLTVVAAQSLGIFSANCLNAFLLEPGFNPLIASRQACRIRWSGREIASGKKSQTQVEKFLAAPFPTRERLRSWFGLLNVFRYFLPDMTKVDAAFSAVRKRNAP